MKYRKKPVVIEAVVWNGRNATEVELFCGGARGAATYDGVNMLIRTEEGRLLVSVGDYITRDAKGEFHRCKPDIFAEIYEPAEGPTR